MKHASQSILIEAADVELEGDLNLTEGATGIVVFAHGSGSSRFSERNRYVASELQRGGLATLLFDLLTADEHAVDTLTRELRFDIPLLSRRLIGTVDWLRRRDQTQALRIGLFGASTGAAAALVTAAERPREVAAVVSRGGRPDMATQHLPSVQAPTLLIVGGLDGPVISMNRQAALALRCEHAVHIVPGATHLFEEPGKLEIVAKLARTWFVDHLG